MPAKTIRRTRQPVATEALEQEMFAPRTKVPYGCERQHSFTLTFALEAAAPSHWDCPRCGLLAARQDGADPAPAPQPKPIRSHWDRLLQRRTIPELEELLAERLREMRGQS